MANSYSEAGGAGISGRGGGGGGGVLAAEGGGGGPAARSGGSTDGITGGIIDGGAPAAASSLGRGSPFKDDGEDDDAETVGGVLGCVGGVG